MVARAVHNLLRIYGRFGYHPGKHRVFARLYRFAEPTWTAKQIVKRRGCLFECDLNEYDQRELYYMGREPYQTSFLSKFFQRGWTAFDVGANCGWYSTLMAKWVGEAGCVHAFEPSPRSLPTLRRNLDLNPGTRLIIHALALGEKDGACGVEAPVMGNYGQDHISAGSTIQMVTLDSFVQENAVGRVDFIKVDIEGYESQFLRGADATLHRFHPPMQIEINPAALAGYGSSEEELEQRLRSLRYDLFDCHWGGIRPYQRPSGTDWYRTVLALPRSMV
jgi:FkbM family methyltransferase